VLNFFVPVQVGCEGGGKGGGKCSNLTCKLQQEEVANAFTPPRPLYMYSHYTLPRGKEHSKKKRKPFVLKIENSCGVEPLSVACLHNVG